MIDRRRRIGPGILLSLLVACGATYCLPDSNPRAEQTRAAPGANLPTVLGEWKRCSVLDPVTIERGRSSNRLTQVVYRDGRGRTVVLTMEADSDLAGGDELHFPDKCHEMRGDRLVRPPTGSIAFEAKNPLPLRWFHWESARLNSRAVACYWFVCEDKPTISNLRLKLRQLLSGLLRRPGQTLLVRVDHFRDHWSFSASHAAERASLLNFLHLLHAGLDSATRSVLFGNA